MKIDELVEVSEYHEACRELVVATVTCVNPINRHRDRKTDKSTIL